MSDYTSIDDVFPGPVGIVWIKDAAGDEVLRDIGAGPFSEVVAADWGQVQAALWDDEDDEDDDEEREDNEGEPRRAALFAVEGGGAVLIEPMSCVGSDTALLRRLTAPGGQALALSWTVNLHVSVTFAARGDIVATFDPMELFAATGDDPDAVAGWLDSLPVTAAEWHDNGKAAAFAIGERLTGIRVDRAWLARPHRLVIPSAPVEVERPTLFLDMQMRDLAAADPRIAALAAAPGPDKLPEIIRMAVDLALRTTGLEGDLVNEVLELLATGERGDRGAEARERLRSLHVTLRQEAQAAYERAGATGYPVPGHDTEIGRLMLRQEAVETLRHALDPDLEGAASNALSRAASTRLSQKNGDYLRHRTLTAIQYYIVHGENWL
ncbi:DUF6461 domain-containing protein [Nonomuraea glycinis]|uniref:Uncharacterized protein n=1 Tax=Nonomuraea glycinis TaxID=2047744 RepID=A0A918ACT0_9ACTN|nr:DUF6461 domain-containing protein [Nonomuraea glycinis]MCA2181184.1 DUF6461 domain-containing protein [Nonomuraea glycinis]GGP13491.1 hypothetical protein GCM10012278_65470 [Nonomuraea glycinis]